MQPHAVKRLIRLLRRAHAGERAAAYAYAGHHRSLRDAAQRAAVRRIADEEWAHRRQLRALLQELGARPAPLREGAFAAIGWLLGALCPVSGWYLPMYGAGAIEALNIQEYLDAAAVAAEAGLADASRMLYRFAGCEREHEAYFRSQVAGHWLARLLRPWTRPADPTRCEQAASIAHAELPPSTAA